ncbi:MAG: ChbG/HpnK family deacetylase [Rhodomicrobium sp.]|nr:ChbG/HpnK family deacetylase [Rhodomicrobium sp.]
MQDIIINADDYAMDAGVDAAILELAAKGRVTAASAMVLSARWDDAARAARDAPPLSFGLHLDLTSPFVDGPLPQQNLPALMARSRAGMLCRVSLRRALDRQLSLFEAGMKAPPAFVDGHQHVHHLPIVRDVLLEALADHYGGGKARIGLRICTPLRWRGVKAEIIGRTGASGLAGRAAARGHPTNSDFAGVYNFAPDAGLAAHWQAWVAALQGARPLIMCHPAKPSEDFPAWDAIRQARYREFQWLASEEFLSMQQRSALNPVNWPRAWREDPSAPSCPAQPALP